MKFNFGTGIVIAIVLFMTFILQYVIRVQIDSRYDNQLVTENYYQQEVEVDSRREREIEALKLEEQVTIYSTTEGVKITFPERFDYTKIHGKIFLYRPSNQQLDFDTLISLSSSNLLIPNTNLVDGRWDIVVEWNYNDVSYRNVKNITIK